MDKLSAGFIAFSGHKKIAAGTLAEVALQVRETMEHDAHAQVLVFNQANSELIDLDYRGSPAQLLHRLAALPGAVPVPQPLPSAETPAPGPAGPGRPRLGVIAREVTLLPRHWEWLNSQTGGASVALRKLVEQARRDSEASDGIRLAREATYRFMSAIAGDMAGFEEATRALFSTDQVRFQHLIAPWPADIRGHLHQLAHAAFEATDIQEKQHA